MAIRTEERDGLAVVIADTRAGLVEVVQSGGHVWRWRTAGGDDVLWQSPQTRWAAGQPLRGGIPLCWPWLGKRRDDPTAPLHGWLRTLPWRLIEAGDAGDGARLRLALDAPLPVPAAVTLDVLLGAELDVALTVENRGDAPLAHAGALHSYLACAAQTVRVVGLTGLPGHGPDGDPAPFTETATERRCTGSEVTVTWYDGGEPRQVQLDDGARTRAVRRRGSRSVLLWNPGAARSAAIPDLGDGRWREFVCIEAANVGPDTRRIEPGASHTLAMTISAG
jgi:glucose-6-phosphate 1-epimerase